MIDPFEVFNIIAEKLQLFEMCLFLGLTIISLQFNHGTHKK